MKRVRTLWISIDQQMEEAGIKLLTDEETADLESHNFQLVNFKIHQRQRNRNVKMKAGVGGFFKGAGSVQEIEIEYLAAMYSDKTITIPYGDNLYVRKLGFGVGVLVKVKNIQSKVNFNFASIAAIAELGLAEAEFSIKGYGIDDREILKEFDLNELTGPLNFDSYKAILRLVRKIKDYISNNLDKLSLAPIIDQTPVELDHSISELDFQKFYFAAKYLGKGFSLEELLYKVKGENLEYMDENICKFVYKYFNVDNAYTSPMPISRDSANSWIKGEYNKVSPVDTLQWIPVDFHLTPEGCYQALSFLDKGVELKPHGPEVGYDGGSTFELFFNRASSAYSSELKLGSMGKLDGSYDEEVISIDAVNYRDKTTTDPIGGLIYGTRYGVGIRFKLYLSNIEFGIDLSSLKAVSAAVELGLANVEYEIEGIGINDRTLFTLFPGPKDLNGQTFQEIIQSLNEIKDRISEIEDSKVRYTPFMILVKDQADVDPLHLHKHFNYCQDSIYNRRTLQEVVGTAVELGLNRQTLAEMYDEYYGITVGSTRITNQQRTQAKRWLSI